MTIRTWTAWNKNRTLTYVLPIFFIFVWVAGFAIVGIYLQSVRCQYSELIFHLWLLSASLILFFSVDPSPFAHYVGCYLTRSDPIVFVSWVLLLLYDTGALLIYRTTKSGMS